MLHHSPTRSRLRAMDGTPDFKPLYLQVKDLMVQRLASGAWRPGEALPSEFSLAAEFRVLADPRSGATPRDYAEQFDMLMRIRDRLSDANSAVVRIRGLKAQLDQVNERLAGVANAAAIRAQADSLRRALSAVEDSIYQTRNRSNQDPLNYPIRLNNRIAALTGAVAGESRPTDQSRAVFAELSRLLDIQLQLLRAIVDNDVPRFNQLIRDANIPALTVRERPVS